MVNTTLFRKLTTKLNRVETPKKPLKQSNVRQSSQGRMRDWPIKANDPSAGKTRICDVTYVPVYPEGIHYSTAHKYSTETAITAFRLINKFDHCYSVV